MQKSIPQTYAPALPQWFRRLQKQTQTKTTQKQKTVVKFGSIILTRYNIEYLYSNGDTTIDAERNNNTEEAMLITLSTSPWTCVV